MNGLLFFYSAAFTIAVEWFACAGEAGFCNVTEGRMVRFGNDRRWTQMYVAPPGIKCHIGAFGADPLPNAGKRCEAASTPGRHMTAQSLRCKHRRRKIAVVGVLMPASKSERRALIRDTYLRHRPADIDVYFVCCMPRNTQEEDEFAAEFAERGDLIVLDCRENMNEGKTLDWFRYIASNFCPYKFVLKADDDTFVHLPNLHHDLARLHSNSVYYERRCTPDYPPMCGALYGLSWNLVEYVASDAKVATKAVGSENYQTYEWMQLHGRVEFVSRSLEQFHDHPLADWTGWSRPFTSHSIAVHQCKDDSRMRDAYNYFFPAQMTPHSASHDILVARKLARPTRAPSLHPVWIEDGDRRRAVYNWPWSVPDMNVLPYVDVLSKRRDFSVLVPAAPETYLFGHNETLYHEQYHDSLYAITMRKAGWDCMRHYEILGDGAVPYFLGLEYMPPNTMTLFPRELVSALMQLPGVNVNWSIGEEVDSVVYHKVGGTPHIDRSVFPIETYRALAFELYDYTKLYLTSSAVFRAALHVATGLTAIRSALFLRNMTVGEHDRADYHEMLAIIGMKIELHERAVEYPPLAMLYDDYPTSADCGWGGCFSYGRRLRAAWRSPSANESDIAAMIRTRKFDIVVYGEIGGRPHIDTCAFANDIKAANYEPNRIWLVRGGDSWAKLTDEYPPSSTRSDYLGEEFSRAGRAVFYREL